VKIFHLILFFLVPALVLTAAPKELRFAIAADPRSFDPLHIEESNSEIVRYLTAGVLVRVNRDTDQPQPELAESWTVTEGGRTLTFHLRDGLKFSDGSTFTTADVARTLTRALDPKEASPAGDTLRSAGGIPEIRVISPRDISIRYKTPRAGTERLFDGIGMAPPNPAKSGKVSAGPFYIAEYRRGDFIRLQRNPNYWKRDASGHPLPYLDSVRLDIQQNHDIEFTRFLRGELHLINPLSPDIFARLEKERPAAAKNLGASLGSEFLWFNQSPAKTLPEWKRQWFRSAGFRHAVSRAIYREDIVRIVYGGNAHASSGPVSTANAFWFNKALKPLPTDPAGALKLLSAEGFALTGGVLRDRGGHPVEFSLITNADSRPRTRMAQLVQADLGKIGIKVNFVPLEFGSLIERIGKTLDYEAALLGFANVELDPAEQQNVWLSSGAQHAWWPSQKSPATPWEARIDELELKQGAEVSREARKKATDEIQRIVVDREPIVYLVNPDYLAAVSPALRGTHPAVSPPQLLWNVEWLKFE
jgi:peptide/nickel transport system substrate-binding protein